MTTDDQLTDEDKETLTEAIYQGRVRSCRATVENWGDEADEEATHSLLLRILRGESRAFVDDATTAVESILSTRLQAARAEAWDEGFKRGNNMGAMSGDTLASVLRFHNPYRAAEFRRAGQ